MDVLTTRQLGAPTRNRTFAGSSQDRLSSAQEMFRFVSGISLGLVLLGWSMFPSSTFAQAKSTDLASESLEDLMNVRVTSVSKQEQKLSQTASAIFVISADDIRHSTATNIPDLLRMVPGMDVAQINSNSWAISARGLSGRFANELLVLLDGRSAYIPTTGGVLWDVLDVPLEDIERIEVIRGPGASIWGDNAVNGVINIITKSASQTQGGVIVAGGGTADQGSGTIQYGAAAKGTSFRAFTKYLNEDHFPSLSGQDGGDGWGVSRVGFRTDTVLSPGDTLIVEGDLYRGREGDPISSPVSVFGPVGPAQVFVNLGGGFLQGVWNHAYSDHSAISLQASYDEYERNDLLGETRGTSDLAFQHHFRWGERQNIIWGFEYRYSQSRTVGSEMVSLVPSHFNLQVVSSFIQDQFVVIPGRAFLTVGTKLEHNSYTSFNAMPTARFAWSPDARQSLWLAASLAQRTPAETDEAIRANVGSVAGTNGPVELELTGNPNLRDEVTSTYEAGYRLSLVEQLSLDFTTYYNRYTHQETSEPGTPFLVTTPPPPHAVVPLIFENLMYGESHGAEIFADWKIGTRWTLSPGYAFQQIHMHLAPSSRDTESVAEAQGSSPVHSAQLRSHFALPRNFSWDTSVYFADRLVDPVIPSSTRLDTGLTWEWNKRSRLSVVGQNLTRDRHEEFVDSTGSAATTLIKRSIYARWTWQF